MRECSKSIPRRLSSPDFINRYFVGQGIDIGGKPDPLSLYQELFPRIESVRIWDWDDGDAQFMNGVADNSFDFVHSSHCLEHLTDPVEGLRNWLRIVRRGGYLVISVPDEDLYEQGVFPSTFNLDHKWTFTLFKERSWSPKSINLFGLIAGLGQDVQPIKVELLTQTYRFALPRYDQTMTPIGECCIEFILRKAALEEIDAGGRCLRPDHQPPPELRVHYNQYLNDYQNMKKSNQQTPPFTNDDPL